MIQKYYSFLIMISFFFLGLLIVYLVTLLLARNIETFFSFPGVYVHTTPEEHILSENYRFNNLQGIYLEDKAGDRVYGIYIDNKKSHTIYYFHGNGGDIGFFYHDIARLSRMGYNVLALEYPGYGQSGGFPHADKVQEHAELLYSYAQSSFALSEENTFLYGYSIGTGVALEFAQGKNFPKIVLEAPYLSRYELARDRFGFALQRFFFLPNTLVSEENITKTQAEVFIFHGAKDRIIHQRHGKALSEIPRSAKTYFLDIPDADHFWMLASHRVYEKVWNFFAQGRSIPVYDIVDTSDLQEHDLQNILTSLDYSSDESFVKYVSPDIPFEDIQYIPQDMQSLSLEHIVDTKWDAKMRKKAALEFEALAKKYFEDTGEKVVVVSSYRSYDYQVGIKSRWCPDYLCAKAGHSEHQSGLAIDIWSASTHEKWLNDTELTARYAWFRENAHRYGFHQSYQNGREVDGYDREPWHWRYVWIELASYLKHHDMTFSQWYKEL